jgi:hypothetical protein
LVGVQCFESAAECAKRPAAMSHVKVITGVAKADIAVDNGTTLG